jgi:hypothetical protein
MPEPQDPSGLWAAVKALTLDQLWPPDDESVAYQLATAWFDSATVVDNAANAIAATASQLLGAWPDVVGAQFINRIVATVQAYRRIAEQIRLFSNDVRAYGDQIVEAKISIIIEIAASAPLYFVLSRIPGGGRLAQHVAHWVANKLTTMITGIVARGVAGLARMAIEIGKEAVDGAAVSTATQLTAMLAGARQQFDVGQVVHDGIVEGVGGALSEGLSAANKATRAATNTTVRAVTGDSDFALPSLPNNMATRVATSAARNGVTSPSASVVVEHHDNPDELFNLRNYGDAIAEKGLSAAIVSTPRTIATDLAIQKNMERFGPVGYERDLLLGSGGGDGGGGGDSTPVTPAKGDSTAAGTAEPAAAGPPAGGPPTETGVPPAAEQQQTPAAGGAPAGPATGGADGAAQTATGPPAGPATGGADGAAQTAAGPPADGGVQGGQDTSPGASSSLGGPAANGSTDVGPPSRSTVQGGDSTANQPGGPRGGAPAGPPPGEGPAASDHTTDDRSAAGQPSASRPDAGPSTPDPATTNPSGENSSGGNSATGAPMPGDPAHGDPAGPAPDTGPPGTAPRDAASDGARPGDLVSGPVVAPVSGVPPATHVGGVAPGPAAAPTHTVLGPTGARDEPRRRHPDAKAENPGPSAEPGGSAPTDGATTDETTGTTGDEIRVGEAVPAQIEVVPARVEVGGALAVAAASAAPPGPERVHHAGPPPRHTRVDLSTPGVVGEVLTGSPGEKTAGFRAKSDLTPQTEQTVRIVESLFADAAVRQQLAEAAGIDAVVPAPDSPGGSGVAVDTATPHLHRGAAVSNAGVLASGEHLPLTEETVRRHAAAAGYDMTGVDMVVGTDPDVLRFLDDHEAAAHTTLVGGRPRVVFGPASFVDGETLVATIAHEMTHVGQLGDGREPTTENRQLLEDEAYASEAPALERYREHVGSPVHRRDDLRPAGPGRDPRVGPAPERPDHGRDGPARGEHGPGGPRPGRGVPDTEAGGHRPGDAADRQGGPGGDRRGFSADQTGVTPPLFRRIGPAPQNPPSGGHPVFAVRPVPRSGFRVSPQAGRNWYLVVQQARAAMTRVVGDVVGVLSVRPLNDLGTFEATRDDRVRSTFTVRVVAEETSDGAPAEVVVTGPRQGVIRVSERAGKDVVDRAVASALAQLGARLTGNTGQDLLDRGHHPGDGVTPSAHDAGRESELRHLTRIREEAGRHRVLRRQRLTAEWRALVEDMGVHPEEEGGPQRRAVSSPGTRDLLDKHVGKSTRRPSWVAEPSGYTPWGAFLPLFGASILPGGFATLTIAGLSLLAGKSLIVAAGVGVMNLATAVTGTLVARWYGRREKDLVDAGHGYLEKVRAHEIAVKRQALTDPLIARMRTMNIDVTVPGPPEPPPTESEPPKVQPRRAIFVNRGVPPLVGAAVTSALLPLGLPIWNLATHWGVAGFAALFGPTAERYLRIRMVSREWKRFDAIGRELDKRTARFDERFAAHLHALMDRIDRIAGVTPARVTPAREPIAGTAVDKDAAHRHGVSAAPNQAGDFARDATGAPGKMGDALAHSTSATGDAALDAVLTGLARFGLGTVITTFLDREFIATEYERIVAQVRYDFGAKVTEQAGQQERALLAMLAEVEDRVAAAEAAVFGRSAPASARHPVVPAPPNFAERPPGHRNRQDFRRAGMAQGIVLETIAVSAAQWFNQGREMMAVVAAASAGIVTGAGWRAKHRRAEQHAVDRKIFAGRAKERVVEAAEALAVRRFTGELVNREVAAAKRARQVGHGPLPPAPVPARPPVPSDLDTSDPAYPDHIGALVAYERERLFHEPRPLSRLGGRLVALDRLDRLVARTRLFGQHAARTGDSAPAEQAREDLAAVWEAYQKLLADGSPMPYDHELYLNTKHQVAAHLRSFLAQSTPVPGGRRFFAPGDPLRTDPVGVPATPGTYTLDWHGVRFGADGHAVRVGPYLLTVDHVAALLEMDPHWHGEAIRLLACESGRGADSFAQRLADRLGVRVQAPTAYYGVDDNGTEFVSDIEVDANGIARPKVPPTGEMRWFEPGENNAAHLAPDLVEPPIHVGFTDLDRHNPWRLRGGDPQPSGQERHLAERTIVSRRSIGGQHKSTALLVELDDGTLGVFKPVYGESISRRVNVTGLLGQREVAASRVDEMLGFGLVPTTTMVVDEVHGPGSLQLFADHVSSGGRVEDIPWHRRQQMAVLDYVIGNTDRVAGNYLTDPNGDPVAIDNAYSFPNGPGFPIWSVFVADQLGEPLVPEVLDAVRAVSPDALRTTLLAGGLGREAVDLAVARLREVQTSKGISGASWPGQIIATWGKPLPKLGVRTWSSAPRKRFQLPGSTGRAAAGQPRTGITPAQARATLERLPLGPEPEPYPDPFATAAAYYDNVVAYPDGMALFAPGDPLLEDAGLVPPRPGFFTVDAHGGTRTVRVGNHRLAARHLLVLLELRGAWKRQPIRLLASRTGQDDDGFAQQLADLAGVPVVAPSGHVAVRDGTVTVVDGEWRVFHPSGERPPFAVPGDAPERVDEGSDLDRHNPQGLRDGGRDGPEHDRDGHWANTYGEVPDPATISAATNRAHILYGDANGEDGGHKHDSGIPFKTTFPPDWTDDDEIIARIEDVARNPESPPTFNPGYGTWTVTGTREGVLIQVFVKPDGTITSGFPLKGEGVHRNDENGDPHPLEGD